MLTHFSNHQFDFPDYEQLNLNRSNHENGGLGLWCANGDDSWAGGFGSIRYRCVLKESSTIEDLPSALLHKMSMSDVDYHAIRSDFLKRGVDAIRIVERSGRCGMVVIMNFDSISEWGVLDHGINASPVFADSGPGI